MIIFTIFDNNLLLFNIFENTNFYLRELHLRDRISRFNYRQRILNNREYSHDHSKQN